MTNQSKSPGGEGATLLPCPLEHDGDRTAFMRTVTRGYSHGFFVECRGCALSSIHPYATPELAAEHWNRRDDSSLAAALAENERMIAEKDALIEKKQAAIVLRETEYRYCLTTLEMVNADNDELRATLEGIKKRTDTMLSSHVKVTEQELFESIAYHRQVAYEKAKWASEAQERITSLEAERDQFKQWFDRQQEDRESDKCPACHGNGMIGHVNHTDYGDEHDAHECDDCFGTGSIEQTEKINEEIGYATEALEAKLEALAKWKCASCGCRFEQLPTPEFMLEGVTRCGKCAENEVLAKAYMIATHERDGIQLQLNTLRPKLADCESALEEAWKESDRPQKELEVLKAERRKIHLLVAGTDGEGDGTKVLDLAPYVESFMREGNELRTVVSRLQKETFDAQRQAKEKAIEECRQILQDNQAAYVICKVGSEIEWGDAADLLPEPNRAEGEETDHENV